MQVVKKDIKIFYTIYGIWDSLGFYHRLLISASISQHIYNIHTPIYTHTHTYILNMLLQYIKSFDHLCFLFTIDIIS